MSILSDLFAKKITFSQAAAEVVQWGEKLIGSNPAVTQDIGVAVSDLKQAASNAVALADTALGAILQPATVAVEAAATAAMTKALGPAAVTLTPAVDSAIQQSSDALKAAIDGAAMQLRASLTPAADPKS